MLKIVQRNKDSRLDLTGGSRLASRQKLHICQACQKLKCHASWSTTGQKVQTGCSITLWLELMNQSSHESKPPASSVLKNQTLHIPFSPQYKYPLYPRNTPRNKDSRLDLVGGSRLVSCQKLHTCQAYQKLKRHVSWSNTRQKVETGHSVTLWLELATQSSRESKPPANSILKNLTLHIPFSPQYKYPLYPRNIESFQRDFFKEKPQRKTRLIHPQSLHKDSSNSSTLFLSIVKSLRGSLPIPFLTIPTSMRRPFGALGSS